MNTTATILPSSPRFFGFTALHLASLFLLSSCQAEMKSVEPTLNPNPKEIYEITVTAENAPGEFISAKGEQEFYLVDFQNCIPPYTSMSGAPPVAISESRKIQYKRVAPNKFVARLIMDRYVPRDDYGRGLCKWVPGLVSVDLYNGINMHYGFIEPQSQTVNKRVLRLEFFNLQQSVENSKLSIPNGPLNSSNEAQYPASEYFYIVMTAKKVTQ